MLVHHGTMWNSGISIAEIGVILSPWEHEIYRLQKLQREDPKGFAHLIQFYPGMSLEDIALDFAKTGYQDYEIEHRVKSVSIGDLGACIQYARQFEDHGGGLVLGIDLNEEYLATLPPQRSSKSNVWYVSRKLGIDTLKEIRLTPNAITKHEQEIKEAFAKYNPKYLNLVQRL